MTMTKNKIQNRSFNPENIEFIEVKKIQNESFYIPPVKTPKFNFQ